MRSQPPTHATALASPLSAFPGWLLLPHCARCRCMRQLSVDRLAAQLGGGTLLANVLPRLRCHRCGEPPAAVLLEDGGGPNRREVWLLPPDRAR